MHPRLGTTSPATKAAAAAPQTFAAAGTPSVSEVRTVHSRTKPRDVSLMKAGEGEVFVHVCYALGVRIAKRLFCIFAIVAHSPHHHSGSQKLHL